MNIIIENKWLVLVCLLAALVPAFFLYFRSSIQKENKQLFYLLFVLRFLSFFFLLFLLLEPFIKTTSTREEKPIVVVLSDDSYSIKSSKDSTRIVKEIKSLTAELSSALGSEYETHGYRFGDALYEGNDSLSFKNKITDIDQAVREISNRYYNRNLGAVVLISDGIYNKGKNPLQRLQQLKNVSFYTVGLGDTLIQKDAILADVLCNKTAYLGNDYPVEVVINAKKLNGKRSALTITDNGMEVGKREISFQTSNQVLRFSFLLSAKTEGLHKITASITEVEGEFTTKNNTMTVYVSVIKNRQQILVLAHAPHPDVAAVKYALESAQNYKVTSLVHQQGANYKFRDYNLVILHQLPTAISDEEVLRQLKTSGVPVLYIMGNATNTTLLTKNTGTVAINSPGKSVNMALPSFNANFLSFTLSDKTKSTLNKFPPLQSPFGEYKLAGGANVLFYQKIGTVVAQNPLWFFNKENINAKSGIVCGEGIWSWKMKDYDLNGNNEAFNEIIQKTVQFLSIAENKSYFRVSHKNEFTENEPVLIDAELFNENYEPINDPEVTMLMVNQEKKEFKSVFSKSGKTYRLNAGLLPPGEYSYEAKTMFNQKSFAKSGKFQIIAVNNELLRTEADHRLLYQMAQKSGGQFYTLNNAKDMLEAMKKNANLTTVSYTEKSLDDIINIKWLLAIPVLLLAIEWFLRKRYGGY